MFNKNIIVGLIVLALLAGGVAFYLMNGGTTASVSAPVARKGELTRELARQMLLDYSKNTPFTFDAKYSKVLSGYVISGGTSEQVKQLADKGMVKIVGKDMMGYANIVAFTDAATLYLSDADTSTDGVKNKIITLGTLRDIQVSGITKQSDTRALVEMTPIHDLNPFGEVLYEGQKYFDRGYKPQMPFILFDDGWRISSMEQ